MTIQEYWEKLVKAGLAPDWVNVVAIYTKHGWVLRETQDGKSYYIPLELSPIAASNCIKLRG